MKIKKMMRNMKNKNIMNKNKIKTSKIKNSTKINIINIIKNPKKCIRIILTTYFHN